MFFNSGIICSRYRACIARCRQVDGRATGLARRFNVTEMVIGLTVVAFGTSLPEFVTSFMSALKGSSEISIGNIVGSNTFNVLMIVGCSALVSPIVISKSTIHKDIPFAILARCPLSSYHWMRCWTAGNLRI